MYEEAEPSADFDKLLETDEVTKQDWFMKYYLPQERQVEIFDKFIKSKKCSPIEESKVLYEIWFGVAPRGYRKKNEL